MKIIYLGNFIPPHSTENHVALSLESLGHSVTHIQEGEVPALAVPEQTTDHDLFLWTQTRSLAEAGGSRTERAKMLHRINIPTAGFHLDRWWGLSREHLIREEPFFQVDNLFTADGGHDDLWRAQGISHTWLPPAVYHGEAIDVPADQDLDVIFVGSWKHYGHPEWWPTRRAMLNALRQRYGSKFTCWEGVRGLPLNALYASAKVVVGDSCLAGSPMRYWSDRVPETIGRGGFLIHPWVEGLWDIHYGVRTWLSGDHETMLRMVDHYLDHPEDREALRKNLTRRTRDRHTYRDRMRDMLAKIS